MRIPTRSHRRPRRSIRSHASPWPWLLLALLVLLTGTPLHAQTPPIGAFLNDDQSIEVIDQGTGWVQLRGYDLASDPQRLAGTEFMVLRTEGLRDAPIPEELKLQLAEDFVKTSGDPTQLTGTPVSTWDNTAFEFVILEPYDQTDPPDPLGGSCAWEDELFETEQSFSDSPEWDIWSYENGPLSGSLDAGLTVSGDVRAKVYWQWRLQCLSFKIFRVKKVVVDGNLQINGEVNLSATYNDQWSYEKDWEIFDRQVASFVIFGYIPINVRLALDTGFETSAEVSAELGLEAQLNLSGPFHYECDLVDGCAGSDGFQDAVTTQLTGSVEVEAEAKVHATAKVKVEVADDDIAFVEAGAKGWARGDLWGYYGNACGDADSDGSNELVRAAALDTWVGLGVVAGSGGFLLPDNNWDLFEREWHLDWWDLLGSGGSTALSPMIQGSDTTDLGGSATYQLAMRPCYPYSDAVNLSYGPGVTGPATLTPGSSATIVHTPTTGGSQDINVTAVSDSQGRDLQMAFSRTVDVYAPPRPEIVGHPADVEVVEGGSASFTVVATGSDDMTYEWRYGTTPITDGGHYSGTTTATLTISNVDDTVAGNYYAVVRNASGGRASNFGHLTVTPAVRPTIVAHPVDVTVSEGGTATFSVTAVGSQPMTWEWRYGNTPISDGGHYSGTTTSTLTITNVDSSVAGNYFAAVRNAGGPRSSNFGNLTVTQATTNCSVQSFGVTNSATGLPQISWTTDCPSGGDIAVQVKTSTVGSVPAGCELVDALWDGMPNGSRTADYMAGGYGGGCPPVTAADFWVELRDQSGGMALVDQSAAQRATYNPPTTPCDITSFSVASGGQGVLPMITWSTSCTASDPVEVKVLTSVLSSVPAGCEVWDALWDDGLSGSRTAPYMAGGYGADCPAVASAWFWVELWEDGSLIRRSSYETATYTP